MGKKVKKVDPATRPPLKVDCRFHTDQFLMYMIQEITNLPTSDLLGFFSDLGQAVGNEGVHFMYENGTTGMRKEIFDYFPGTAIPFCMKVDGSRRYGGPSEEVGARTAHYNIEVGFPSKQSYVDQTTLANIIMEKAILGGSDMPRFQKPDTKCPKMYTDLMKEIQSRRMV